jgi:hypothetical protein
MKKENNAATVTIRALSLLATIALLLGLSSWPVTEAKENGARQREQKRIVVNLARDRALDGYTIFERDNQFFFRAFNVRHPKTGKLLEGRHDVEIVCDQIPNLPKLRFNKGNSESTRIKCLMLFVTPRVIIQEDE